LSRQRLSDVDAWAKTDFHEQVTRNPVRIKIVVGEALNPSMMRATFATWYPNVDIEVIANAACWQAGKVRG
jgi:hypothetical protein